MGAGASNLSTSDMSIYQSSLTKIGQDIRNKAENITNQQTNVEQELNLETGATEAMKEIDQAPCNNALKLVANCIENNCHPSDIPSYLNVSIDDINKYTNQCTENCNKLACSQETWNNIYDLYTICGVSLKNVSSNTLQAFQIAEANTDTQMLTNVGNNFESEMDNKMSQKNSGINFQQRNTAKSRMKTSQDVKNIVSNSINNTTKNVTIQTTGTKQTMNVRIASKMDVGAMGGDSDSSGCTLDFTNESVNNLSSTNTANSILKNLMDSDVTNALAAAQTSATTQSNVGIDPLAALLGLLLIPLIIAVVLFVIFLIGFTSIYSMLKGSLKSVASLPGAIIGTISGNRFGLLIFFGLVVMAIVLGLTLGTKDSCKDPKGSEDSEDPGP